MTAKDIFLGLRIICTPQDLCLSERVMGRNGAHGRSHAGHYLKCPGNGFEGVRVAGRG